MTPWTIILCEGDHDRSAIASLACVCAKWKRQTGVPNSLPEDLRRYHPMPKPTTSGEWRTEARPDYLVRDDQYMVIRSLGGIRNVLGQAAVDFLEQASPSAVGVVVDANDVGVAPRVDAFRRWYRRNVEPGTVSPGTPRIGLWVAPDNCGSGRLEDLLLAAATRTRKRLVQTGQRFAASLEKLHPGEWTNYRSKAVLGAIHQIEKPGASLAIGLQTSKCWFDQSLATVPPFDRLLQFLDALTAA